MQVDLVEGPLWVVRDSDDEIIAVFKDGDEEQAHKIARERHAHFDNDEGVFICVRDERGRPHGWYGPFDTDEEANEYALEVLQLDPDTGEKVDMLGEPIDEDVSGVDDEMPEDFG